MKKEKLQEAVEGEVMGERWQYMAGACVTSYQATGRVKDTVLPLLC